VTFQRSSFLVAVVAAGVFLLAGGRPARAGQIAALSSATVTCDYLEYRSSENVVTARGNAVLVSSATRLDADGLSLDLNSKIAHAKGRVRMDDGNTVFWADAVDFDWESSTGVFTKGYFEEPPYRLWARRIVRVSSDLYHMEHVAATSCELDPPHYHIRMASMDFVPSKKAFVWWPRLALGDDVVLGLPFYRKTFGKKLWALTVDPGRSNYHGLFAKSVLTYRLTEHGTARILWDHYERTGDGLGAEYTFRSPKAQGTVNGYKIEDVVAGTRQWKTQATHWQALTPRLTLEVNGLAQNNSTFNNLYSHDDLYRVQTEAQSSAALTYRQNAFTTRLSGTDTRTFDPLRGAFVGTSLVAPEAAVQGSPWQVARDTYLTSSLAVRRRYDRPLASPPLLGPLITDQDRFRETGEGSLSLKRRIAFGRWGSLEPSVGTSESWQSWVATGTTRDDRDQYVGRVFTGINFRQRLTRSLDYDLTHRYEVRWSPNQFKRDHASPDQGLETNLLSWDGNYWGNAWTGRLSTGYDLRDLEGESIRTLRRKITPPVLDLTWRPSRRTSATFREVYGLYPARHSQSTEMSWRFNPSTAFRFSSGFSYNGGLPGQLLMRHGAAFPLSAGWSVEGNLRYALQSLDGKRYNALPKERLEQEFVIQRDMHCWEARFTFRKRPGYTEALVRLELKSHAAVRRSLESPVESQYYPGREAD
jgi:hypothetical protein